MLTGCRFFNGYKPCGKSDVCDSSCPHQDVPEHNLLIVHLGAMGAVVRSTALLPAIKNKFPSSRIYFVTSKPMDRLLDGHPFLDKVCVLSYETYLELRQIEFAAAFVIDKALIATGFADQLKVRERFGFVSNSSGSILPATPAAQELWEIGLSDQKKFYENSKTECQLIHEAMELGPYQRFEYHLHLSSRELQLAQIRKKDWIQDSELELPLIGLNTGCGSVLPAKKFSIEKWIEIAQALKVAGFKNLVLLGGPEDFQRNQKISLATQIPLSEHHLGVRDGVISVEACDLIITGDSYGMHLGIARRKYIIAWFGPSCEQEIDLFARGIKIKSELPCSPCWKRDCEKPVMCYSLVDSLEIVSAVKQGAMQWELERAPSLFRQPFSET
jgi:heptosyltransferase-2